jgi:hypothetical protein
MGFNSACKALNKGKEINKEEKYRVMDYFKN